MMTAGRDADAHCAVYLFAAPARAGEAEDEQLDAAWTQRCRATGAMKSPENAVTRAGRVPAGAPGAGLALLLVLAMAQFMVLDFTIVNVASLRQSRTVCVTTTVQWL